MLLIHSCFFYSDDESYGYCPDHIVPKSEECSENYDRVDNICIRVSPHPLNWLDAENQCVKEGGHLLHILSEQVQMDVEFLVRSKMRSKEHFTVDKWSTGLSSSMENIWIGGAVSKSETINILLYFVFDRYLTQMSGNGLETG